MDNRLQAHLAGLIPTIAPSVMRDANREIGKIWNAGRPNGQNFSLAFGRDDVEQEMWLAAVEHEEVLTAHLEAGNETAISTVLKSAAKRMVSRERREQRAKKAALAGYETYDEFFYTEGALRRLIPVYLDAITDDGIVPEHPPLKRDSSGRVSGRAVDYGDYLATMIDIHRAMGTIGEGKRKLLGRYFAYPQGSGGFTHNEIAGRMGIEPPTLTSRVQVAIRGLQKALGDQNPWNHGPTPKGGSR